MPHNDTRTDAELLRAWKAGDRRAGMVLCTRHHVKIVRFFMNKAGPGNDDLVQATFLGLLESIENFRGEASFRTYLFSIARNKLYRHFQVSMRDRQRFVPDETSVAALGVSPSQVLAVGDRDRLLLAALRTLPLEIQMMLELHYWEGLQIWEVAKVLEKPVGTVKTRMRCGRRDLERKMTELAESKQQLELSLSRLSQWAERMRRDARREKQVARRETDGPDARA